MKHVVRKGSHTVVINSNDEAGPFWASLYVNSTTADLGDITNLRASRQSLKGIQKWAEKVLAQ